MDKILTQGAALLQRIPMGVLYVALGEESSDRFSSVCSSQGKSTPAVYTFHSCYIISSQNIPPPPPPPPQFFCLLESFFCQKHFRYVYNIKITIKSSTQCGVQLKKVGKADAHLS